MKLDLETKIHLDKFKPMGATVVGKMFGDWLVIEEIYFVKQKHKNFLCRCKCGKIKVQPSHTIKNGKSRRCAKCANYKHGMCNTRTYRIWGGLHQRCTNPKTVTYRWYGAKGIRVCDRWLFFENFYEDMGDCPYGLELDRIDSSGNYCKENCRWVTRQENIRNRKVVPDKMPGKKFGEWYVLERSGKASNGAYSYECRCKCGTIKNIPGGELRRGKTTRCKKCSSIDKIGMKYNMDKK